MEIKRINWRKGVSEVDKVKGERFNGGESTNGIEREHDSVSEPIGYEKVKRICDRSLYLTERDVAELVEILQEDNPIISKLSVEQVKELNALIVDFFMNEALGRAEIKALVDSLRG